MDASRILSVAVVAARRASASVLPLFKDGIKVFYRLAEQDLEGAETGLKTALEPMLGPAVLAKIYEQPDLTALQRYCDKLVFENYFELGRSEGNIPDELLAQALPAEALAKLPAPDVMAWLAEDESRWWAERENAPHLASVVAGVLEGEQALRSEFIAALNLEEVFKELMEQAETASKLARFAASLRSGVKTPAAYDTLLFRAFSVEELVSHADPDAVWEFCRDTLRQAVASSETPVGTCSSCGTEGPVGTDCPSCGTEIAAPAPDPASSKSARVGQPAAASAR